MSSENTRKKALQILRNEGVEQVSAESFTVKSPSGSKYEVAVKINEERNEDGQKEVVSMQINNCSCSSWTLGKRTYCSHGDAVELYVLGKNSDDFYCHECQVAFSSEELLIKHLAEKQTEELK
jgi:hypothetical protein